MDCPTWQGLMDASYDRWKSGDLSEARREDFVAALDETHRDAVLLGNLNYQVENGGFSQWVDNGHGVEISMVRAALRRLGTEAAKAADAMLGRLEPHLSDGTDNGWVMGEPYESDEPCPDCDGGTTDEGEGCGTCGGGGSTTSYEEWSDGWDIAESLDDEYYAIKDSLMPEIEAWLTSRVVSHDSQVGTTPDGTACGRPVRRGGEAERYRNT